MSYRDETMQALVNLRQQLADAKTIGEMDQVREQLDTLATGAAERGESSLQALLEDAASGIRRVIYQEIGKRKGMGEDAIRELQEKHEAAIRADNMMRRTANHLSTADDSEVELFNARMRKALEHGGSKASWLARCWNALKATISQAK